ncbi:uncharacterized protein LOC123536617 [Mercenaria mercenaria]|uniref:uncharacterized protein LOC123536617 n=1 Tax=Mercenaria mercenaria TaxID=6596 RepID=UPI00234EEC17|nr:uncharacterized protein LOC123536617 [Mercenaria mercenaria]
MERRDSRPRTDRREVHSVCIPVPMIVLDNTENADQCVFSHSRSTGDLDAVLADVGDYEMAGKLEGLSNFSRSISDGIHDTNERDVKAIRVYCSPRLPRRSAKTSYEPVQTQSRTYLDYFNACNLNYLGPGSRVGSAVSLNSEFTSRSVGLISNDSNSESSQHVHTPGMMDWSGAQKQKNVLRRFYSSPEKDDETLNCTSSVRRNSKSMGNMQQQVVSLDFGSDSTEDENFQQMSDLGCDIDESLAERTGYRVEGAGLNSQSERNLVTAVTGGATLRNGRIRKWLTEISDPDDNSNT